MGFLNRSEAPDVAEVWARLRQRERDMLSLVAQHERMAEASDTTEGLREDEHVNIARLRAETQGMKQRITDLQEEIRDLQQRLQQHLGELEGLGLAEKDSERNIADIEAKLRSIREEQAQVSDEFQSERTGLDDDRALLESAAKRRRKATKGPALPIQSMAAEPAKVLHVLGDVHGWAPGLIRWWGANGLHDVDIAGLRLGEPAAEWAHFFPNQLQRLERKMNLIPTGLDGHPARPAAVVSMMYDLQVHPRAAEAHVVLLGDLIDRGDHPEVVLELVRQSLLSVPGRRWTLLGNHEQLLLERDASKWQKEEQRWMYEGEGRHVGTVYLQPSLHGADGIDEAMRLQFDALVGQFGALLHAQHLGILAGLNGDARARYESLVQDTMEAVEAEVKGMAALQKDGTWKLHNAGAAFLGALHKASFMQEVVVPGGIMAMRLGSHLMLHGEPTGLEHLTTVQAAALNVQSSEGEVHLVLAVMKDGRLLDPHLLHARGFWAGAGNDQVKIDALNLSDHAMLALEGVSDVYHGHTPTATYKSSDVVSTFTVHALDEGMTPVYHYDFGGVDTALDPSRVPHGIHRRLNDAS